MGKKGLEPLTLRLSSVYSSQLSYLPFNFIGCAPPFDFGKGRIRTYVENNSTDLQSVAFNRSATFPQCFQVFAHYRT
jgi:hypothetical protein